MTIKSKIMSLQKSSRCIFNRVRSIRSTCQERRIPYTSKDAVQFSFKHDMCPDILFPRAMTTPLQLQFFAYRHGARCNTNTLPARNTGAPRKHAHRDLSSVMSHTRARRLLRPRSLRSQPKNVSALETEAAGSELDTFRGASIFTSTAL